MITVQFPDFQLLAPCFKETDFFVFGEMHGVMENALIMKSLLTVALKENRPICLAFEWLLSDYDIKAMQNYIKTGEKIKNQPPEMLLNSDGRFTVEHIELLKYVSDLNLTKEVGISIGVFDSATDDREKAMAVSLRSLKTSNNLVLVETGVAHAHNRLLKDEVMTFVSDLSSDFAVHNSFVLYSSGEILVEDQIYKITESYQQKLGPADDFMSLIEVPHSSPENKSNLLTGLEELYTIK